MVIEGKGNRSATLKPQVIINSIVRSAPKAVAELSLLLKKVESWNPRLKGTARSIWSNLSWQKHGLDKMAQHHVQPNLKSVWEIPHLPGEIIPMAVCSQCEKFCSYVQSESSQE